MPDTSALRADCANCFGLCCVALTFSVSADFAIDKDAGEPCPNLQADNRCSIHQKLRPAGFPGCTTYDCFGAGQHLSQVTFGGRDWRQQPPDTARQMFDALPVLRQLHELLWYLTEARALPQTGPIQPELATGLAETERLARLDADALLAVDVAAQREAVSELLRRTSEMVRAGVRGKKNRRGADLIGAKLRGADLRGADLRGAYLIGADLRGADLRLADVIGADLRDTDLRGANLTGCLFLTQTQANAARGDATTRLPASITRPSHW